MSTKLGFRFDSAACSGCKTCQAACKDKHRQEVGVRLRRVYEIAGGEWKKRGDAWLNDVFAYHLSLSCNHCARPICVEVCPSLAMTQGSDGIVRVNDQRCLGCGYCGWACPYGAPQYDTARGLMTKCDLCADYLEQGKPPACVAACPMRALEIGSVETLEVELGSSQAVFPLPQSNLTEPNLFVKPHPASQNAQKNQARVANREEVEVP